MEEHFLQCPYCWQNISMLLDPSISRQKYVEDCEICCNPIEIAIIFQEFELVSLEVRSVN